MSDTSTMVSGLLKVNRVCGDLRNREVKLTYPEVKADSL